MVDVPSRKPSPEPQDDEEDDIMDGVESNDRLGPLSDLSDSEDDDKEGGSTNGVHLSKSSDNVKVGDDSMVAVESEEPTSEANVPLSDAEDSEEDNEEYQPTNPGTNEATTKTGLESNEKSDFESLVDRQESSSLRRSSRNNRFKSRPTVNYADYPAPRKSSYGRKKLILEDEYRQMASLCIFPFNKLNKFNLG
jgi:hypothetical protein